MAATISARPHPALRLGSTRRERRLFSHQLFAPPGQAGRKRSFSFSIGSCHLLLPTGVNPAESGQLRHRKTSFSAPPLLRPYASVGLAPAERTFASYNPESSKSCSPSGFTPAGATSLDLLKTITYSKFARENSAIFLPIIRRMAASQSIVA